MRNKISIYDFFFNFIGHGHYNVTYTSPITNKKFTATTNNMPLIDATKNTAYPKIKDLNMLKYLCKNT